IESSCREKLYSVLTLGRVAHALTESCPDRVGGVTCDAAPVAEVAPRARSPSGPRPAHGCPDMATERLCAARRDWGCCQALGLQVTFRQLGPYHHPRRSYFLDEPCRRAPEEGVRRTSPPVAGEYDQPRIEVAPDAGDYVQWCAVPWRGHCATHAVPLHRAA